jgi:putative transposase
MKRPASEALDVSRWPSININALEEKARDRYQQRATAVERYATGVPIGDIEEKTQLDRRVLYRMIERALQPHPDGRPWGFRALVPGSHTKTYQRCKASTSKRVGLAGAFSQLLEEYPKLEQLVRQLIVNRDILLVQKGDQVYLKNLRNAHNRFTAACRSIGLTAKDYPLNQDQKGRISFGSALRYRMMQDFKDAHRSAGGDRLKPASALAKRHAAPITEPFDTVEVDAHRLDLRLKILDQDPYGDEQLIEIERVWLLALIDVFTRAILGYTLCLRREYSRYDVIRTFEKALSPASMPALTIPGLAPIECGGFVSAALPETTCACWRQIRFDHARAHLAADSLNVACELLGCTVDVGPAYQPDERPFIERFFGTVATRFSHRLPGTTGSDPDDILRKLKDPHGDLRLVVSLGELRELLAVWVWNYNGTPHGGLGSAGTPLEAMTAAIRGRRTLLRHLPLSMRGNLCLLQSAHPARVRGHINRGEKPHISFYHVRYTSHRLARTPELIGKPLRVYYDANDIRVLRAFLADATELGVLIIPIPKIREEHLAEARRLNGLDAKRGAVELDGEGAVIDDLEQRRRRWRRWCGLSKIIVMRSPEERVPIHSKMARPASLDNCENLIEMLLRRKRLSLPARARDDSQRLLELTYPATLPTTASSSHAVTGYRGRPVGEV